MNDDPLSPLDLAAYLCSRVCHDVISPVGAITNGLEVLDEDGGEMRGIAMDLIKKSAAQASAKLQFARLAFGAAGSAGAEIDLADAEGVARGLLADSKVELVWEGPRAVMAKNKVKLLLNLIVTAQQAIPRGGTISVTITGAPSAPTFTLRCTGQGARIPEDAASFFTGGEARPIDAHSIQPYYAALVARDTGMGVSLTRDEQTVTIEASPDV
ncbi:MAG: histidine phosphotransferase family protein [Hyphomicrobiales bacterium]|nr:histidine phosphotransferase family protein [Hyphomicrobiales bacterium]